jgi:hypothetical protein
MHKESNMKPIKSTQIILAPLVVGLILTLSGCGGGGGGGDDNTTNHAPETTNDTATVTRDDVAVDIDVLGNDTDGDGDTLTLQSVTTPAHGTAVIVNATTDYIRYTPPSDFSGAVTFDYTITDGNATDTATVTVTVNKAWDKAPTLIEDKTDEASTSQIAVNANGDAMAIWLQKDGTYYCVYGRAYIKGSGWKPIQKIRNSTTSDAVAPQIALDNNGNAIAIWEQNDGTRDAIFVNHYTASTQTWGGEMEIDSGAADTSLPQIAIDSNGNAIATWCEKDHTAGTRYDIWASRYTLDSGWWGQARLIEHQDAGDANAPQIAMDDDGNAIVTWSHSDGTRNNIRATHYLLGIGWAADSQIIEFDDNRAYGPHVDFDGDGNALAVWKQWDGAQFRIQSNRYIPGSGWEATTQLVSTDAIGSTSSVRIAMNQTGNATAVWLQYNAANTITNVQSNRYLSGTGWQTAQKIETDDTGSTDYPCVAIDNHNNTIVLWAQGIGTVYSILTNRHTPDKGWGEAATIENDDSGHAWLPHVAIDNDGDAIAIWSQWDGTHTNIFTNRYW